jgi:hypothetical protein
VALTLIVLAAICFFASIFFLYVLLQWMRETKRTTNALTKKAMAKRAIKSEPVLLGPPAGKTAGYRWTVREGWVVRENGKQIAAFSTKQGAMAFRDRGSADEDAPDKG